MSQFRRTAFASAALSCVAVGLVALPHAAKAQAVGDTYWIEAAYYHPSAKTSVQVEDRTDTVPATVINLEDDLNFKTNDSLPSFKAGAKLGGGFRVFGEYFAINRSSEATISKEIRFAGIKFDAAADVASSFKTDTYRVGLGWDFLRGDSYAVGGLVGLHATNFEISLEGEASIGDASKTFEKRKRDALAPLPTVGLYGLVEVVPGVTLRGQADYLKLTLNNAEGRIFNAEASVMYNFHKNFAVGAGYRHVDLHLQLAKPEWVGSIDYQYDGPSVFLKVGFP